MAAGTSSERQRRRRRKRLVQGLILGGAALGLPALANALIARRNARLPGPTWGRPHRHVWRHGEIAFQRLGHGDPLLLVHSLGPGQDSEEWRAASELLATGYRVYAPDLLGWGRSEMPRIALDGELYIQLLTDLLEEVVREKAVVVAAGLPAAYAVQLAVDRPELVRALALVGPGGIGTHGDEPDLKDALLNRFLKLPLLGTSALNLYTSRAGLGNHLRQETFSNPERVDAGLLEHQYRAAHQPGAHRALAAYLSGYLNHGLGDDALDRLSAPLWLAWGRHATTPPVETADLWQQQADGADLEVFDESGNLPHLECPAQFCRRLAGFLGDLEA